MAHRGKSHRGKKGRGRGRGGSSRGGGRGRGGSFSSHRPLNQFSNEQQKYLHEFAKSKYEASVRGLNFSGLINETSPKFETNDYKFMKDFFYSIPPQDRNQIEAISLANNNISNIKVYEKIGSIFRNLKQLIFDNNAVKDINQFNYLSGVSTLEKLSFKNNPCSNQDVKQLTALQTVKVLNDQPFQPPVPNISLPPVVKAAVEPSVSAVVQSFAQKYYSMFSQGNRQQLGYAYDPNAVFSYTINPAHSLEMDRQATKDDLKQLRRHAHDITFNQDLDPVHGNAQIVQALGSLPQMQFSPDFSVDAHLLEFPTGEPTKIILSLHGQLQLNNLIRNYDRTFILLPADDANAKAQGWDVKIINEQFNIVSRVNDTDLDFKVAPSGGASGFGGGFGATTGAGAGTGGFGATNAPFGGNDQNTQIQQLSQQTNMTNDYAKKCLEAANWNLQQAYQLFQQNKGMLPREAFRS